MANLPQSGSISMNSAFGAETENHPPPPSLAAAASSQSSSASNNNDRNMASSEQLVLELSNPELRENALLELSKVYHNSQPFSLSFFFQIVANFKILHSLFVIRVF
jgi:CCR4-NOT transcription complex subunit 9